MPTLQVKTSRPQSPDIYAALAAELTHLTALHLHKRPEVTAVMFEELPANHWYIGGQATQATTVFLEISVTAGTNTVTQKSAFMAAAFAALTHSLGRGQALETASYVIVHELPATDWGYDGQSQAARKTAA